MAILSDKDRREVWAELMRDVSANHETCAITKAQLRDAVNAADQWMNDNAASYNSALPTPTRTGLTMAQKARLLMAVVRQRFVRGV